MAPKYDKVIICLANSRKISGRCLAGKEASGSTYVGWIRPVSSRQTGELSEEDRRYENGRDPGLLDIVRIPLIKAVPNIYQAENHLIDDGYYWTKEGEATLNQVGKILDPVSGPLWDNSSSSTYGINDRVADAIAALLRYSGPSAQLIETGGSGGS